MTPQFHPLTISAIERLTPDAIAVSLLVPMALRTAYQFTQGQFITFKAVVEGEELRRSYSICQSVPAYEQSGVLCVGIKAVGRFSHYANQQFQVGQVLEVMTPDGRFFTPLAAHHRKHYLGIAGGSGITPLLSLIATTLATEPHSRFTLLYGNRTVDGILFIEALAALKNHYLTRFIWHNIISDEPQETALHFGLLNQEKCQVFLQTLVPAQTIDEAFVCGPALMMDAAEAALKAAGVTQQKIHIERFASPDFDPAHKQAPVLASPTTNNVGTKLAQTKQAQVKFYIDGKAREVQLPFEGASLLDVVLQTGANVPYACKAGVCCTCRAKVLEGSMRMEKNYILQADEIAQGFVLTCQAHPISDKVVVSYDER